MKKHLLLVTLILLSFVPLIDLLQPGLPVTHDGKDHVVRIANFYQNLTEGNIIPRWGDNLNWGYGHPVMMFLYPLPSYIASFFYFLSFSFVDSVKLVFATAFVASGVTMYLWLKEHFHEQIAFLGGILYLFAPYRFVDLYVRGAIGEHVAFVFPPLVLYFIHRLKVENTLKAFLGASVSLALLILAHNAVSLMFLPVIAAYSLFLVYKAQKKKVLFLRLLFIGATGFMLAAFFWIPAFMEGKYTLRDIVISTDFSERLFPLSSFIYSPWGFGVNGFFSLQIGIVQLILFSIGVCISVKLLIDKKQKALISMITAGMIVITVFLMTTQSLFLWERITLIQKFQFPWRFLTLTVFLFSFYISLTFSNLRGRALKFFVICVTLVVILIQLPYMKAKEYVVKDESFYTSVYAGTTDTGESSPVWSVRFMEEYPKAHLEVIDGIASINESARTSEKRVYKVIAEKETLMRENTLYFPGWGVTVNGQTVPISYQNQDYRGIMTFTVPTGENTIEVKFTNTKLRSFSEMISVIGVMMLLLLSLFMKSKIFNKRRNFLEI